MEIMNVSIKAWSKQSFPAGSLHFRPVAAGKHRRHGRQSEKNLFHRIEIFLLFVYQLKVIDIQHTAEMSGIHRTIRNRDLFLLCNRR